MGRFIFDLPDELRERLEGHRVAWGRTSLADALRHLIETKADAPFSPEEMAAIMAEINRRHAAPEKTAAEPAKPLPRPRPAGKGVEAVQREISGVGVDIQIGPTPVKAGDRLKTAKGTKR